MNFWNMVVSATIALAATMAVADKPVNKPAEAVIQKEITVGVAHWFGWTDSILTRPPDDPPQKHDWRSFDVTISLMGLRSDMSPSEFLKLVSREAKNERRITAVLQIFRKDSSGEFRRVERIRYTSRESFLPELEDGDFLVFHAHVD